MKREMLEFFVEYWKLNQARLVRNKELIDIFSGTLKPYVERELKKSFTQPDGKLSPSYQQCHDCLLPINILEHTIDKKSKIYQRGVRRLVTDGGGADTELVADYEDRFSVNRQMNIVNEYFNLFDYAAVQPVVYNNRTILRPLRNDKFLAYSNDHIDPSRPTHFLVYHGSKTNDKGEKKFLLRVYSEDEFLIFNEDGIVDSTEMGMIGADGTNPFGHTGIYYFNKKDGSELMPQVKDDIYTMATAVPIILTHCNFGLKFQSFSILYTIDVDEGARPISPNVMWSFQTDKNKESKPEVGSLNPNMDSDKNVRFLAQVLTLWFQTHNIKPGNMDGLSTGDLQTGISKIMDEMDTSEDRTKQIEYFRPGEEIMWKGILQKQHPVWVNDGGNDELIKSTFTDGAKVSVEFPEQLPLMNRKQEVDTIRSEINLGLETRLGAMRRLNPELTEDEAKQKLAEVEAEKAKRATKADGNTDDDSDDNTED